MGFEVKVTNSGDLAIGRDNKLFEPGDTVDHTLSGAAGLLEIVSHPDLSAVVTENTDGEHVPENVEVAEGIHTGPDATETAAQLAMNNHVQLSEVPGTGTDGRILKEDVEQFIQYRQVEEDRVTSEDPIEEQEAVMIAPRGVQVVEPEAVEGGIRDEETGEAE